MDGDELHAVGAALAARHAESAEPVPQHGLINYAERPRIGDWTMRSALMRYAQPHAVGAARVITLVRRLDAVLHQVVKPLERHTVDCDRALTPDTTAQPPADPYPDTRTVDLARLERADPAGFPVVLRAYEASAVEGLDGTERSALPLLGVALQLDALAETLTEWAQSGPHQPPVDQVDAVVAAVERRLDELGVPVEAGPPPGRRGRRDRGV